MADPASFHYDADALPFTSIVWPVVSTVIYVAMVVGLPCILGNSSNSSDSPRAADSTENSLLLTGFEIVHNVILIVLSTAMCLGGLHSIFLRIRDDGGLWEGFLCPQRSQITLLDGPAGFWMYIYYLSKYYELVDTLILILKRKEVIFLHKWHHAIMVYVTWSWLNSPLLEGSLWCVFVNSLIHMFMYTYYLLTVLGYKKIWWKKNLTGGQIVQFWTGMLVCACFLGAKVLHGDAACSGKTWACVFSVAVNCSFILLFNNFFTKSYSKKKYGSAETNGSNGTSDKPKAS